MTLERAMPLAACSPRRMEMTMNENLNKNRTMNKAEAVKDDMMDRAKTETERLERDGQSAVNNLTNKASDVADTVSTKLKTVGVDTDVMVTAAKDQATELQRMLAQELQARPMRALGVAAAVGLFVGLMTTR
jgi:ElaB/YqjD/DUF883 family membrane-anchored ribosome-binding protein